MSSLLIVYLVVVVLTWAAFAFGIGYDTDRRVFNQIFDRHTSNGGIGFVFGLMWFIVIPIGGFMYLGHNYRTRAVRMKDSDRDQVALAAREFLTEMTEVHDWAVDKQGTSARILGRELRSWSQKYE